MTAKFLVISLILFLFTGCRSQVNPVVREVILKSANAGNYASCLILIRNNYTDQQLKSDTQVFLAQTECFYRLGKYIQATESLVCAREKGFVDPLNYFAFRAKISKLKGYFSESLLYYDSALAIKNPDFYLYSDRALVYMELKEYDKAIEDCFTSLRVDTGNKAQAYINLGNAYMDLKKFDTALIYLNKAREQEPGAMAYVNIGVCYYSMGENETALENFTKAIELDSSQAIYYYNRGNLLQKMGKLDKACNDWYAAMRLEPYNEDRANKIKELCK